MSISTLKNNLTATSARLSLGRSGRRGAAAATSAAPSAIPSRICPMAAVLLSSSQAINRTSVMANDARFIVLSHAQADDCGAPSEQHRYKSAAYAIPLQLGRDRT